ncbi:hypothetical protein NP493_2166g00012 [Ridgeia piscesae]|uniref:Uncharacterized protein n=1 Tax=Ridgeia piscesae TaxID=27915 RepID=A0AAD9JJX7_RIDPI|nr:hypothetical protein NP493_2166g00012 [Ridgeia piscesae]
MTLGQSTPNKNLTGTEGATTPQQGNVAIGNSRKRPSTRQPVHARDGSCGLAHVAVDNGKRGRQQPTNDGWGDTFKSKENFVQMHAF